MQTPHARYHDGRDEMNLADFPISALQRAQKTTAAGKLDRMEFKASRYDSASRSRVQQKVTLTSTARDGLPTPADEHVILALLYLAKHSNNFADATVHFSPSQLFEIMAWAPNGRSYTRLRDVLRRLKSLTIRYENAWWDMAGRAYEEEVATGILSAYKIARQVSGPRKPGQELMSYVTWTQAFHESLKRGNLKRLNLEVFFKLQTPTAQRMYRFLDKRFYTQPSLSMDLVEFACGHVGLAETSNVAILKRRLAPAIEELEQIGFLQPMSAAARYQKVKVGEWRIVFQAADVPVAVPATPSEVETAKVEPVVPDREVGNAPAVVSGATEEHPGAEMAREFYRLWDPLVPGHPGERDMQVVTTLLAGHTAEQTRAILTFLVSITKKQWPRCRSLSGAAQKYLSDAIRAYEAEARRAQERLERASQQQNNRPEPASQQNARQLRQTWDSLPDAQRRAIEQEVRGRLPGPVPAAFLLRLCLEELSRRLGG